MLHPPQSLLDATLTGPRAVLRLGSRLHSSSLRNASAALAALAQQVEDRRQLAPVDDDAPGALSRIPREECLALLAGRQYGRLAYVARQGAPDVVPVNYAVDGSDVLVRSGAGPKLQAAERREVLVLEVDDVDETAHTGWSVVVVGPARRLSPAEQAAVPAHLLPDAWARGPRSSLIRIRPTRVDGRRLH